MMENFKTKQILLLLAFLIVCPFAANGQDGESTSPVNVFLDASGIDDNYIKQEFTQVNYVNNKDVSNVYILGTRQSTGAGAHYQFFFFGSKEFAGKNDTLSYYSSSIMMDAEVKEGYTKAVVTGLMRYLALANYYLDFEIVNSDSKRGGSAVEDDPWDSWVFDIGLQGSASGETSKKNQNYSGNLGITRVTPEWRYEFMFDYSSTKRITQHEELSYNIGTVQGGANYWIIKSLGPHAGMGIIGEIENNSVDNYDFNSITSLAAEYNFFPYDMSSRRQLYVTYSTGLDYRNYTDSTFSDLILETITFERLVVGYSQREQWGSVSASASFQHFYRDIRENNLGLNASLNLRIWKGLSWNFNARYSIINDDVNVSKRKVKPEDLLAGTMRLPTKSSYSFSTGLNFTFGSIYNNVVNTRLRRGGR